MTSYHVNHERYHQQPDFPGPSPPYQSIIEAPPPPYPPVRTRYQQDYYGGYRQQHPPTLRPYRDESYGEGEYEGQGCFPFLRSCLTALCCCWFVEQCCFRSRF